MNKNLRIFENCPICGKYMGPGHISGNAEGSAERFQKEIDLNRNQPRKFYEDWLANKRSEFTALIHENHLCCDPENFRSINHNGLIYLSVLYCWVEMIDNELNKQDESHIIEPEHIILIYKKFKVYFEHETKENWLKRFVYPCQIPIEPIIIDSRVKGDNNRLALIAILDTIQAMPRKDFIFDAFVCDRFGLKDHSKAKSIHKDKPKYKEHLKLCNTILKT